MPSRFPVYRTSSYGGPHVRLRVETLEGREVPASIAGTVWDDLNANGQRDPGEAGLAGGAVFLDRDQDGHWDDDEPRQITDGLGTYTFLGLTAGTYSVALVAQAGRAQVTPAAMQLDADAVTSADWRPVGVSGGSATTIAIAPNRPELVLAGVGASLHRSTDGGSSWVRVAGLDGKRVQSLVFTQDGTALAGTADGLWKSTDGGGTWNRLPFHFTIAADVGPVAVAAANPSQIWLGLNTADTTPVLRSTDGGATWRPAGPRLASGIRAVSLAVDPTDPTQAWIGYSNGQIWFSGDDGRNWQRRSVGPGSLTKVVADDRRLLALGREGFGLQLSTDDGQTWQPLTSASWPSQDVSDVAIDPINRQHLLAATAAGVNESFDGGATWNFGVAGTAYSPINALAIPRGRPGRVLAAVDGDGVLLKAENSPKFVASASGIRERQADGVAVNPRNPLELAIPGSSVTVSDDGGQTWQSIGLSASAVQFSPDGHLYAVSQTSGVFFRRDEDATWSSFLVPGATGLSRLHFQDGRLFAAGRADHAAVWESADGGQTWTPRFIGTAEGDRVVDLVRPAAGRWVLGIEAESGGGRTLVSTDDGRTWATATGLPEAGPAPRLAASPTGRLLAGTAQGLFGSSDFGTTWASLAEVGPVADLLIDPNDDRIVYVVAGGTVLRSLNGGASLTPFRVGLTEAPRALARSQADGPRLFAATARGLVSTPLLSRDGAPARVVLGEADTRVGVDFSSKTLGGEITGRVFEDRNGDGQKADAEPALRGWTVFVDADGNGRFDVGEDWTATDAKGAYRLTNLEEGKYTIGVVVPGGWKQTKPTRDGRYTVRLSAGKSANDRDFGVQGLPNELRGIKWLDRNGDGVRNTDEQRLAGWTIYIDRNGNGQRDEGEPSRVTDAQGEYVFSDVGPGTHIIAEEPPSAFWRQTYPGVGNSERINGSGPAPGAPHFKWADKDPSTPDVIDLWYDFRAINGYSNQISGRQKEMVGLVFRAWREAGLGRLRFVQNTTAADEDVIIVGTGDLAAVGDESAPGGALGYGGAIESDDGRFDLTGGFAWLDVAENWDTIIGNGDPTNTYDYFTVAAHEIGHALGLPHADGCPGGNLMDDGYSGERPGPSAIDADRLRGVYSLRGGRALGFHVVAVGRGETKRDLDFGSVPLEFVNKRFDFGTPTSPVAATYTGVTPADGYTWYRSYGWSAADAVGIDRAARSALTRDFVGVNDGTFLVDVPSGRYRVAVVLGDALMAHDKMAVYAEDKLLGTVTTAKGQAVTKEYTVTVRDGRLTLRFADLGGKDPQVALAGLRVDAAPATGGPSAKRATGRSAAAPQPVVPPTNPSAAPVRSPSQSPGVPRQSRSLAPRPPEAPAIAPVAFVWPSELAENDEAVEPFGEL